MQVAGCVQLASRTGSQIREPFPSLLSAGISNHSQRSGFQRNPDRFQSRHSLNNPLCRRWGVPTNGDTMVKTVGAEPISASH